MYVIIGRRSAQQVNNGEKKLRSLLNDRIKAAFLKTKLQVLKIKVGNTLLTLPFESMVEFIRNKVNKYIRNFVDLFIVKFL